MKIKHNEFTALRGHVIDNCVIIAPSGKEFTLKNTLNGWIVYLNNVAVSGYLKSAIEVEYFVINGLYSH